MIVLTIFIFSFIGGFLGAKFGLKSSIVNKFTGLIQNQNQHINMTLDQLKAKVDAETTVDQSAITLLQGLSAQLKAALNDPAAIQAIADEVDANAAALAAAVSANTAS